MSKVPSPVDNRREAEDPRWIAVLSRDASADGSFVYGVKTTGLYCQPSTPSKLPLLKNIEFFDSPADAEAAGYRLGKRAADQIMVAEHRAQLVATACRILEDAIETTTLTNLAQQLNVSPFHFHRIFKAATGLSPRAFAMACHARRVQTPRSQECSSTPDDPLLRAPSNQRHSMAVVTASGQSTGHAPLDKGDDSIQFAMSACALGFLLVARSPKGITAISLGDSCQAVLGDFRRQFPHAQRIANFDESKDLIDCVVSFIEAPGIEVELALDIRGTAFQKKVWHALRQVPPGSTVSYIELANTIGAPKSVRAVEQACRANPLAVVIPCHRVLRKDGRYAAYPWGLERKSELLRLEASLKR
ncbi:methylated-DNA--[protein]-cysteine S-methyltransferase [Pseudomonas sp. RC10]|uniref:methylated-DNA--[protein]-cysteine S-methyltransferase n=1 Tax=Pseudomonas bambusae TaxID=3139142 RepID=UPI003139EC80